MTLEFPNSPSLGDTYTSNNLLYTWDGEKWTTAGSLTEYATKQYVDSKAVIGVAAWGRFQASAPQTLLASYNIAGFTQGGGENNWDFTFINAMANANYAVVATVNEIGNGSTTFARVRNITDTGFRVATHFATGDAAFYHSFGFAVYAQTSL
jgi:hypothetical protein